MTTIVHSKREGYHLNDKVVAGDLQCLSREYAIRVVSDDESPLVGFKIHYPVLFECLEAISALYASNSTLAEQIHGDLSKNLRVGTGMDKGDALGNNTSTKYNFRGKRRQ